MTIKQFIELYRECEREKLRWGIDTVTLDYFIDWLEGRTEG